MAPAFAPDTLPAGPGWPLWQTLHCLLDPIGFHQRHARRFGDMFSVQVIGRTPKGGVPMVQERPPTALDLA